ncbi:MAG: hypothetical protein ACRYGI_18160 [Janthinobacterium lividum]
MKALPAFTGFVAVGCVLLWLALSGLLPVFRAIAAGAPIITLVSRDAFGLPLAVSFFALAAMTLYPTPVNGRRRARGNGKNKKRRFDGPAVFLGIAVVAALCAVVASPVTEVVVQTMVTTHGYIPCAPLSGERPAHARWIRAGEASSVARCPEAEVRPS